MNGCLEPIKHTYFVLVKVVQTPGEYPYEADPPSMVKDWVSMKLNDIVYHTEIVYAMREQE